MNQADFTELRTPMMVLVIVLAVGCGAIYYSDRLVKQARQQLVQQEAQLKEARTRLQKSDEEKGVIVAYLDNFRKLESDGIIGEEQRINWLDGLRLANQQSDLFGVTYQIDTQKPYPYAAELNPGQLVLSQSTMHLAIPLLHEEDLMRFIGALRRQGGGLFAIDQCVMRRLDRGGVIRFQPNVNAECDLSWITLRVGPKEPVRP